MTQELPISEVGSTLWVCALTQTNLAGCVKRVVGKYSITEA
jgi:hypothetical protein